MSELWIKWWLSLHEASDEIWLHRYFFIITFSLKVFLVVTYIHILHQYFLGYIIANWWIEWLASFQVYKKRSAWVASCFLFLLLIWKSQMHHNGRNASIPHCRRCVFRLQLIASWEITRLSQLWCNTLAHCGPNSLSSLHQEYCSHTYFLGMQAALGI